MAELVPRPIGWVVGPIVVGLVVVTVWIVRSCAGCAGVPDWVSLPVTGFWVVVVGLF